MDLYKIKSISTKCVKDLAKSNKLFASIVVEIFIYNKFESFQVSVQYSASFSQYLLKLLMRHIPFTRQKNSGMEEY